MTAKQKDEKPKAKDGKPHPSEVRYVFLDTQVFEKNQYDLHSKDFQKLVSLAELGKIQLLTTDITMREITTHVAERANEAEGLMKKVQRQLLPLMRTKNKVIAPLMKDYKSRDMVEPLQAEVKHFFQRCNVETVPVSEQDLSAVLDLHFDKKPPFNNPKKRGEFPDALVMLALKSWSHRFFKRTVHIVSGDSDWCSICQTVDEFKFWELLSELLAVFQAPGLTAAIEKGFQEHRAFVCDMIASKFADLNFYFDQASGEISNMKVKKVEIDRIFVVEADKNNKGRIDVECLVAYSCDTVFDVPGTGYYDQRERCHVPPDRKWARHEASETFMVEVDISWNAKKPSKIVVDDQRFKTRDVVIDLGDLVGIEL